MNKYYINPLNWAKIPGFKYILFFLLCISTNGKATVFADDKKAVEKLKPVLSVLNSAPIFNNHNYTFIGADNATLGSSAGAVTATDPDGDALTYSIKSGNTNSCFSINPVTGSITVAKLLNHHTQSIYTLTVKANDVSGLEDEALVSINVEEGSTPSDFDAITWSSVASQPYTVNELQGEVVNGKLYTFGGFDSQKSGFTPTSRAYTFDPIANTWASIASMPPMNGTNYGGVTHAGFTTDGTDIYFGGGYTSNSTGTGQIFGTKEVWKYIVSENRYVRLPDLPIVIAAGQLEYLSGKLHHISGTNAARTLDLGNHYVLDLDSLGNGWKTLAPLPNPRQHAGSVVYENKIYFIGGQHGQDSKLVAQKDVHSYDPVTNTWTKLADLPVPSGATGRGHISSAAIISGKYILVLGGETVHATTRTNMVSAYTPSTNVWKNLTPLPQTRYSGVAANLKGMIYYTAGSGTKITYRGITSATVIQKIQNLTLINTDTQQPLQTISNGDTLNLATLPTKNLNIQANTSPAIVGSVVFSLTGSETKNVTENNPPYALFGDSNNGHFNAWTPVVGDHVLSATPFSASGGGGVRGTNLTVSFTVINKASQNISLFPLADAFVRSGTYSGINYGSDPYLDVKGTSATGYARTSYLKFSLSSLNNINSAKLRVYGNNADDNTSVNISVYPVTVDSWAENTITWNNAPSTSGAALISSPINGQQKYYEFDVTGFVKTEFSNDKVVSFMLKDGTNAIKNFLFNSKENQQNTPELLIEYSGLIISAQPENSSLQPDKSFIESKIYPNPVHEIVHVQFQKNLKGSISFQIGDALGRKYNLKSSDLRYSGNNVEIDVSKLNLQPGIYYLLIHPEAGKNQMIKLLVE